MTDLITPSNAATNETEYITLAAIAEELGMDRSRLRRYAIKNNFVPFMVRTPESQWQKTLALSPEDAEALIQTRTNEGYIFGENGTGTTMVIADKGVFYMLLLIPEFSQTRIKIGFAGDLSDRIAAHRTTCPTLAVLKSWPCKRSWEKVAIDCVSVECQQVGQEVFDCPDTGALISRIDAFFALMPSV